MLRKPIMNYNPQSDFLSGEILLDAFSINTIAFHTSVGNVTELKLIT